MKVKRIHLKEYKTAFCAIKCVLSKRMAAQSFKFNHENLIIDPNDVDEAVIQTPGLKLYKNGLIESELNRAKFNNKEYKEETIVAKNRQGETVYYRVLAQVLDSVLELQESDLFELQIDGDYLELQEE